VLSLLAIFAPIVALALVVFAAWLAIRGLRRLFARRAARAEAPASDAPPSDAPRSDAQRSAASPRGR
jgi:hypothetical protein